MAKIDATNPIIVQPKWKRDLIAAQAQPQAVILQPQPIDPKKKKDPPQTLAARG